jgi:hypothetical protein
LEILQAKLPEFKEMISSFMSGKEDEELLIYLVAKSCSKAIDLLGACFYLILQLLYQEEIIKEKAILDWVTSAREKIEKSKSEDATQAKAEEKKGDVDSYYGEEANDDEEGETISIEDMEKFVSGMKKFEEYLQSQIGAEDGEYYDEEEGEEY